MNASVEVTHSIGLVERETGISKDTLRIWERRYGFPQPHRDTNGERVYPQSQVARLRLIKRLVDLRYRPGKIVARELVELEALLATAAPDTGPRPEFSAVVGMLRAHDFEGVQQRLAQSLMRQGLEQFVMETIAPLNVAIGEAWANGELAIHEEHLYTQQIENSLRHAIFVASRRGGTPRVLLTSMPGEQHRIGLLMAEALLATAGATCIPLGAQTPSSDITLAAVAHRVDIVALSFSASFPLSLAQKSLLTLRSTLPAPIGLWAGGQGLQRSHDVFGITILRDFDELQRVLSAWRAVRNGA